MDRTREELDDEDGVEADAQVAEKAPCMTDAELSAEERLRDAYRLW